MRKILLGLVATVALTAFANAETAAPSTAEISYERIHAVPFSEVVMTDEELARVPEEYRPSVRDLNPTYYDWLD